MLMLRPPTQIVPLFAAMLMVPFLVSVIDRLQLSRPSVYRNNAIIVNLLGLRDIDNIAGLIHWPIDAAAAARQRCRNEQHV